MIALDTGTATVLAALIAAIPAGIALWNRRALNQINRAVNHVEKGEPTLIQRVKKNEEESRDFQKWVEQALVALAQQVGVKLDRYPGQEAE
jgi:HAMP domain-containing protein